MENITCTHGHPTNICERIHLGERVQVVSSDAKLNGLKGKVSLVHTSGERFDITLDHTFELARDYTVTELAFDESELEPVSA